MVESSVPMPKGAEPNTLRQRKNLSATNEDVSSARTETTAEELEKEEVTWGKTPSGIG